MPVTMTESFGRQATLLGLESSYGTGVTVDTRLMSLKMPLKAELETEKFWPSGFTAPVVGVVNDDYASASGTGKLDYNAMGYILTGMLGEGSIEEIESGIAYGHSGGWNGIDELDPESYTLMYGKLGASTGRQAAGLVFTKYGLSFNRRGVDFTTEGIARALETGKSVPNANNVTVVEPQIVFPKHFEVWVDDAWEDLGETKVTSFYDMSIDLSDMLGRVLPINNTDAADGLVETEEVEHSVSITMAANNDDAFLADSRAGSKLFVRVKATGPVISGSEEATAYSFTQDMCIWVDRYDAYQASDNVHVIPVQGTLMHDEVSGECFAYELVNGIADYVPA